MTSFTEKLNAVRDILKDLEEESEKEITGAGNIPWQRRYCIKGAIGYIENALENEAFGDWQDRMRGAAE